MEQSGLKCLQVKSTSLQFMLISRVYVYNAPISYNYMVTCEGEGEVRREDGRRKNRGRDQSAKRERKRERERVREEWEGR